MKKSHTTKFFKIAAAGLSAALILFSTPVLALTFRVNTTLDTNDAVIGNCRCFDGAACSLRAAIQEANACAGTDTILLQNGNYVLTNAGAWEDNAVTGDLDILEDVVILGRGSGTVIDGNGLSYAGDRVFDMALGGHTLTLSQLTVTNGIIFPEYGGGVRVNDGGLIINNCTFTDNHSAAGGAIYVSTDATLIANNSTFSFNGSISGGAIVFMSTPGSAINDSSFTGNLSTYSGGAIVFSTGTLDIEGSSFVANTAGESAGALQNWGGIISITNSEFEENSAGSGYYGGAIDNGYDGAVMTIANSKIFNNTATYGGGLYNSGILKVSGSSIYGNTATTGSGGGLYGGGGPGISSLVIENSTISGNSAATYGGGFHHDSNDTASLSNVTITNNDADTGGRIYASYLGTLTLRNTLLATNTAITAGNDCDTNATSYAASPYASDDYNLVGDVNHCYYAAAAHDQYGDSSGGGVLAPSLDVLADNGGATPTHALLTGSPSIDAGNPAGCANDAGNVFAYDQRGNAYSRTNGAACDVGAFEF